MSEYSQDTPPPDLDRWEAEGGATVRRVEPVSKAAILEVLDLLATKATPIASGIAADLAAAIRFRGLGR